MGNTPSLHETVFDLRYNAKQLERMSKKCEKNAAKQRALVKAALEKGNMEGARIYGANAIREKNQGLNYLRLASRVEGAAARVESAAQTQKIMPMMSKVTRDMKTCLASMDATKLAGVMEQFETVFDDMDVRTKTAESTFDAVTSTTMPEDQVDSLMKEVAAEHGLQVADQLEQAGRVGTHLPEPDAERERAFAERLQKLRAEAT